ncbi:MAG: class I SAM-dependent methyltransferase [Gammaproteobacteria bacterium]|uniref:class I SAM-dependent methyltransferase n=1 Tax=Rhodoferax sp. TaxID=50421 RepID=UPI0018386F86|nr:class I SAM-dependent methyltransferase [Rhodoferax sp.]MBU3900855.1 class I SAM-dependent methyltransferase [Gammaproteobacteria bacterium]MBA3059992.1 methyltransferase domain-containing protein [Rhodoferax sp.]MBU3996617.1 class I SAM-dependent methyltransferase [Gammaproteobacteria bacterium]MBU4079606.1 class I SAM-dependent methyltransferase [Gammaproteobacteria bacterium]MBU4112216.1 class I SAM-dependent methyltransferase [Gammaproteobacteria bacterium]
MTAVSTDTVSPDRQDFKIAVREQWDRSAAGWNSHTPEIRAWLRQASEAMLDMAGVKPGAAVLDVAAGAGDQTLDIAKRVGPAGRVLATDLSPAILALADINACRAGFGNVQTLVADGEALAVPPSSFDAAVCRLGLMFFPDPLQGLHSMYRALRPGGGICTLVFSRPERNPCLGMLMGTALKHAGQAPRDPFQPGGLLSLGKPGLADALFQTAGFRNVASTALDAPFQLPSARHYLDFVRASASPIQQILGRLSAEAADAAWAEMEQRLGVFTTADGWIGPNELLLTAAQR